MMIAAATMLAGSAIGAVPSGVAEGEVVVSVFRFKSPGMPDKVACRIRVVVENRTDRTVGFYGRFHTLAAKEEVDTWFLSAGNVRPSESTERLYSCLGAADTVALDYDAARGFPNICDVSGRQSSPCPFKVRMESNLKVGTP
jgi:hypothetical protein